MTRLLRIAGTTILAVAGLVAVAVWLVYFPPFVESHRRISTDDRVVAITYDDGPNPPHTERLLEVLERHGAKATFFVIGRHVELHPETVRRVVRAGHQVGNHSYSHVMLGFRSVSFVREEIARTDALLRDLGVVGKIDVRAPHVAPFLPVAWVLGREQRRHIGADVVPQDWETEESDLIVERVLRKVSPGSIVLLHDGIDFEIGDHIGEPR